MRCDRCWLLCQLRRKPTSLLKHGVLKKEHIKGAIALLSKKRSLSLTLNSIQQAIAFLKKTSV
ncbi:MAG: hypothetical protein AB1589_20015 [Cyanobacteriota bacterium]